MKIKQFPFQAGKNLAIQGDSYAGQPLGTTSGSGFCTDAYNSYSWTDGKRGYQACDFLCPGAA